MAGASQQANERAAESGGERGFGGRGRPADALELRQHEVDQPTLKSGTAGAAVLPAFDLSEGLQEGIPDRLAGAVAQGDRAFEVVGSGDVAGEDQRPAVTEEVELVGLGKLWQGGRQAGEGRFVVEHPVETGVANVEFEWGGGRRQGEGDGTGG